MARKPHPLGNRDLYTPVTPEVIALLERCHQIHGTWRNVSVISGTKLRVIRSVRNQASAVSQKLLDRICQATGVGSINDFTWFTAEDLVNLGIWKETQYVEGRNRIKGDEVTVGQGKKIRKKKPEPEIPEDPEHYETLARMSFADGYAKILPRPKNVK